MSLSPEAIADLTARGADRGADLRPGLALVEQALAREARAPDLPLLEAVGRYLMDAGGKRFRPMLVLLAGMAGGAEADDARLVDAGVIVELVHLSTLYHDDVIDAATIRRGLPAAQMKWSNTVSILAGDWLLARASLLSAALGVEVTRLMASTIADLCQGQIREVQGSREAADHNAPTVPATREHYLKVVGEKTASLIAASCRLGGMLSGQPPAAIEALTDYGWRLGMAFQLADDVLDIAGIAGEAGKLPGTDLREGVKTLPVLLALEADGPDSELAGLLERGDAADVERALALLNDHPALGLARDAAKLEAAAAAQALEAVDATAPAAVEGLAWLAEYAVGRVG